MLGNSKFRIHESLSYNKCGDNGVNIYSDGYFKMFECDFIIFDKVIKLANGKKTTNDIIDYFKDEYKSEEVISFLKTLLDENVLKIDVDSKLLKKQKAALIGKGTLNSEIKKHLIKDLELVSEKTIKEFLLDPDFSSDVSIIIDDELTFNDILSLNNLFVKSNKPYIISYYDGAKILVGPFVFPWQTPCFECVVSHHIRNFEDLNGSIIDIKKISNLYLSHESNMTNFYSDGAIECISKLIITDINQMSYESANFLFSSTIISYDPLDAQEVCEKTYTPITDCSSCNGMNKEFKFFDGEIPKFQNVDRLFHESEIKYNTGGIRSKSKDETKNMVDHVLNSLNIGIEIKKFDKSIFSNILPVYDSFLKPIHKNSTPYFFTSQTSHGKGLTKEQAYFSATFEIFERISAKYYGKIPVIRASVSDVKPHNIDIKYTTRQIKNIKRRYEDYVSDNQLIDWVWGQSLISGEPKLIPACDVFLSDARFRGEFVPSGSSGMASGATLKDAILQGLLEVVEHDGWMIGQANKIQLPIVSYEGLNNKKLENVINNLKKSGWNIISRDYTTDIGLPTIRTWVSNSSNYSSYAYNGFGCAVSPELALERSVTEAIQGYLVSDVEDRLKYRRINHAELIKARDSLYGLGYFQWKDIEPSGEVKKITDFHLYIPTSAGSSLKYVVDKVKSAIPNCDILYVNLTREVFGIPVVKVIVTGDIQRLSEPLFNISPRMYSFQKNMGYGEDVPSIEELYLGAYPH